MMEQELCGVILINKHKGVTSHGIVNSIRRIYKTKRVGHTGTLDPLATGVLPVLIGRGAKAAEYLISENKEYIAELVLGIETDTEDITGNITQKSDTLPTKEEFFEACKRFVGKIKQVPPMYSALKVDGQKLVDLARRGISVEREARDIEIFSIVPSVLSENEGRYKIKVSCSKGTYIRTLITDIGRALGSFATMTELERTKSGDFLIEGAHTINDIENMTADERASLVMPIESLFMTAPLVSLPDFYARLCRSGCEIYQRKISTSYPVGTFVRIADKNGFFAIGKVLSYGEESAIKALKLFVL